MQLSVYTYKQNFPGNQSADNEDQTREMVLFQLNWHMSFSCFLFYRWCVEILIGSGHIYLINKTALIIIITIISHGVGCI